MKEILPSLLSSFVATQNLHLAITNALRKIGQYLALNRICLVAIGSNEDLLDIVHEWCSPGISSCRYQWQGTPVVSLPAWMDPLKKNQNIVFPELKGKSGPGTLCPFGTSEIQALLIIPLWAHGQFAGFVIFEDLTSPRDWRMEDIQSLRLVAGIISQIKSAHQAEEELRKTKNQLEAVFSCIADPLNIQDRSLTILMCNPARATLYNVQPQDIIGRKCYEAFHNRAEPCLSCAIIDAFQTGKPAYRLRCRENTDQQAASWAEVFAFPIRNAEGEVIQAVEFSRDITQRKQAEDEIRKLYAELERKVEERTIELQKIQEEMVHKEKLAVIGQLIGSVGHEFRSSLTILSGVLYLLKNRDESEDIEEFVDTLEEEIHKMSRFVEDLLDLSRTSPPRFQQVDLEKILQKLLQKIDIPSDIQVVVDYPKSLPKAFVDPDHAEQIFHNIISNAIQAMPCGGRLKIQGSWEGARLVLSFTDTGVGISPINIRKIFTPLFTTKSKGTGLGLAIVNMLIKKNKGTVTVESVPNQGTTFTVAFQITPGAEKEMF
ncbi:MAG: ATP-binding protein [bacterium]